MVENKSFSERIHCSSDPFSLDAVIIPEIKVAALDGTPPHAVEPLYPGAFETTVNMSDCWDEDVLRKNREKIIDVSKKVSSYHNQCVALLKALSSLICDNSEICSQYIKNDKIKKTVKSITDRETKQIKGKTPLEKKRFLSSVTPKGFILFTDTVKNVCDKIYLLKDPYGGVSEAFIEEIRKIILKKGFEIYTAISPLTLKPEHILVPKLKLGFLTSTSFLPLENAITPYRTIHYTRFCDTEKLKFRKARMKFNLKVAGELLNEAVCAVKNAKETHDVLESFYKEAIDYDKVKSKTDSVLKKVENPPQ